MDEKDGEVTLYPRHRLGNHPHLCDKLAIRHTHLIAVLYEMFCSD
jgi:hypothetical protein